MGTLIEFPLRARQVSKIRNREKALAILIPKLLGMLWKARQDPKPAATPEPDDTDLRVGGYVRHIDDNLVVGGQPFGPAYMLYVYCREPGKEWRKVFSVHVADRPFGDPAHFKYWNGRCSILSWRRGDWEDRLCSERDDPRTLAHVQTVGLVRPTH